MADYRGFRIPEDLHYDLGYHVWLRAEGEVVAVGATDPAQASAGEIIHIDIKKVGTRVERGAILATIESAKFMGPMRSPVTGTVVEINQEVAKKPVLVNQDAYANWVARLKPEKLTAELALLTSGAAAGEKYQAIIDDWGIEKDQG
ncbi:MAG TPA: biotin/lipoyl-containing protein [Candidatus Binataceae bacterium]|nr:biotin/lipoyl-containing protein [Candidatus Binataceae bacterium]